MHCWSHDDDLGVHMLWMDNEWQLKFGKEFLGRTHFACNMQHGNKEKTVDVYDSNNEELNCGGRRHCHWLPAYSQLSKKSLLEL
ncbi:hypothetical protein Dsin_023097 [Dipteronia sinensis]|uniref:S-protein homolog n=1 Tax=Dipteronia sinensis TaxID=43782 RepID=A0AAE0A3L7_9ROSI|nr:hypothetical protein Dsin_023097 [Dipteronia sinensis]